MVFGSVSNSVLVGMVTFLVLHLYIWRVWPSNSPRIFILGILAGVGVVVSFLINILQNGLNGFELCSVLWIDIFAIIFYVFVYAGLARSVSITLLSRLLGCENGFLDFNTLIMEYTSTSRFDDRIQLMENSGLVLVSKESVTLTRKGFVMAKVARALGQVLGEGLKG